jgi:SagB-type dehydrogenase family enzyme
MTSSARSLDLEALAKSSIWPTGRPENASRCGTTFSFRSAPSAGALYPNEIYLVWPAQPGQSDPAPGVFNYDVHNHSLVRIATGSFPAGRIVPVSNVKCRIRLHCFWLPAFFSAVPGNIVKRAYRYVLLDAGHVMESLRLAIRVAGFSCRLTQRFDDPAVNRLLGLDPRKEVGLGCVYVDDNGPRHLRLGAR